MVNYANTKIYMIHSPQTDKVFISHTCRTLKQRIFKYKFDLKQYNRGLETFNPIFDIVKHDDVQIQLLENYPCNNIEEVNIRKKHYFTEYKNRLVNEVLDSGSQSCDEIVVITPETQIWLNEKLPCCLCQRYISRCDFARHEKSDMHVREIEKIMTYEK